MPLAQASRVVIFGTEHLITVAVIAAAIVGLTLLVRYLHCGPRLAVCRIVLIGLGVATLAGWITALVMDRFEGRFTIYRSLPLHLCNVAVLITTITLWLVARSLTGERRAAVLSLDQRLYEVLYFWGLGFTLQAILTPDLDHHFPHPTYLGFFISHSGILAAVFVMTFGLRLRPLPGAVPRLWVVTTALMLLVLAIDFLLGGDANYMYLRRPAPGSLMEHMGPWPWYLLTLQGIGIVGFLVLYSPWWILDRVHRTGTTMEPRVR